VKPKKPRAKPKPKLPRGGMPPPERVHRDRKKEKNRTACRQFRKTRTGQ